MTLAELDRRLKKLDALPQAVRELISSNPQKLTQPNKDQLYTKGQKSDGSFLRGYANGEYAQYKNFLNSLPGLGQPDLFETGAFYNGFFVKVESRSITFGSTDQKSAALEQKYGKEIFGLTEENKKIYQMTFIRPEIQKYITKVTGLQFK